ncbi:anaphase-promoting complex subunit Apc8 [Hyaloraphidium curvatum]|nr:anaphase-promoting complex subunit Apc8 [Hyaloraphidium curvatum]
MTAELLTALAPAPPETEPRPKSKRHAPPSPQPADDDDEDADRLLLSKAYFDMKELDRAAQALEGCTGKKAVFQRLYYLYLAGERRREEDAGDVLGPLDPVRHVNRNLPDIETELSALYEAGERDPFICYLYAVVLARHPSPTSRTQAADILIAAVTAMPCLWAAWAELGSVLASGTPDLPPVLDRIPDHFMATLFRVHLATEHMFFPGEEAKVHSWLDSLEGWFPGSKLLLRLRAIVLYESRDYEAAEAAYSGLLSDPHSLDGMDGYANVLFVMEKRAKLGYLAQQCVGVDRWRRETGVVVGNYYSLRGEHEKAVMHFRRALRLDRNYLAAWTLMGHEYVEMKNTAAAVEAYRRAVDINPRDFRAWYGLGQAYEVLRMPYYSVYYYQRAAAIKPHDSRMWTALASAYESLASHSAPPPASYGYGAPTTPIPAAPNDRLLAAIRCYKRALRGSEDVPFALVRLARLYGALGDHSAQRFYYGLVHRARARLGAGGPSPEEFAEACVWLARDARGRGELAEAEAFAGEAGGGEEARSVVREIRAAAAARVAG